MTSVDLIAQVEEALAHLPSESGGIAVVLATAGLPPAMAVLSSGDIHLSGRDVRVGIHGSSSAATRLGGGFTLLVPLRSIAVRVEVSPATAIEAPPLVMLVGQIESIRPTAEPPWVVTMEFAPESRDHPAIPGHVEYWKQVKSWLAGDQPDPPQIPG